MGLKTNSKWICYIRKTEQNKTIIILKADVDHHHLYYVTSVKMEDERNVIFYKEPELRN